MLHYCQYHCEFVGYRCPLWRTHDQHTQITYVLHPNASSQHVFPHPTQLTRLTYPSFSARHTYSPIPAPIQITRMIKSPLFLTNNIITPRILRIEHIRMNPRTTVLPVHPQYTNLKSPPFINNEEWIEHIVEYNRVFVQFFE